MDFIKWSARYGKNRFYKVLLFFIIFCIFTFFIKSCKVHASAITTGSTTIYSQTQNCDLDSNNNLTCTQGTAYKFLYSNGATNVDDIDMPFFIPNEHNILVSNLIYDVDLGSTKTISSTNKHILLHFPEVSQFYRTGTGSTNLKFAPDMFPRFPQVNDSINHNYRLSSVLGFKPYYCSYFNVDTNQTETCDLKYDISGSVNIFTVALNLPTGTKLNHFTISFGTNQLYTGSTKELCGLRVPNSDTFYNNNCNSTSPYDKYVQTSYNLWRNSSLSSIGLFYYVKGATFETPKFYLPNYQDFVATTSNDYSNNSYGATFTTLSAEQKELLNSQVTQIEQQIQDQSSNDNWFENSLGGFTSSDEANSFVTLFNSLIHYPLQKFRQQNQEKLTWTNINGTELLSDHICRGSGIAGDFGTGIQLSWHGATFKFPCVHKDIYAKMYNEDYAFYPPILNGASIVGGNNNNFYSVIKIIIDGILIYYMFISCLDIYKYILDSDRKEIEVLDL